MNTKQKVLQELQKKDFPDLKFLYSKEVLDVALEILRELLKEEKQKFKDLLKTSKEEITFETFEDDDNLGYFWNLLNHLQGVNRSDEIDKIIETFEPEYLDFANEIAYNKSYFEMLKYCLENCKLEQEQTRIIKQRIKSFKLR